MLFVFLPLSHGSSLVFYALHAKSDAKQKIQPLPIICGPAGHFGLRLCHYFCKKKSKNTAKALLQAIGANGFRTSNPCLRHPSSSRLVPHAQTIAKKNCNCSPTLAAGALTPFP